MIFLFKSFPSLKKNIFRIDGQKVAIIGTKLNRFDR